MLFDIPFGIPFIVDWNKIRDYRQRQTDLSTACKNKKCVDYDYKVGDRVLVIQDGILRKAQSPHGKKPSTITTVTMTLIGGVFMIIPTSVIF